MPMARHPIGPDDAILKLLVLLLKRHDVFDDDTPNPETFVKNDPITMEENHNFMICNGQTLFPISLSLSTVPRVANIQDNAPKVTRMVMPDFKTTYVWVHHQLSILTQNHTYF